MSEPLFDLPESFDWEKPETWPDEVRMCFEYTAKLAYLSLAQLDKKMLDCEITGTDQPVTMLFAVGERAEELRRAWRSVYAIHNEGVPKRDAPEAAR